MYLKEDIIGAASGFVYGLQGDEVKVIREELEMCLVERNNQKFFVRYEKLSEEAVAPKAVRENPKGIQRIRKGKR